MAVKVGAATPRAQTILAWLAGLAVLYWAKAILIPIALSVLLTFLLAPLVTRLQRLGIPKVLAVAIVVAVGFVSAGGVGYAASRQIVRLAGELSGEEAKDRILRKVDRLKVRWGDGDGTLDRLSGLFDSVRKEIESDAATAGDAVDEPPAKRDASSESPKRDPVAVRVEPEENTLAENFETLVAPLLGPLGAAGLVVVLVVFMLLTREDLRNRLVALSGHAHVAATTKALDEAGRGIARYLLMQFVINVSYGFAVTIGLLALGVPYAELWGTSAALLRYIPYAGPLVAAVLPVGYSVLTSEGWWQPLGVVALIVVLELLSNNVMEPLLYGRGVGITPVAVILAALFWGWLWGPIGLVLATPLTVCLVVAGRYVPALAFFSRLLSDVPESEPHFVYYQRLLARDDDEAEELFDDHVARRSFEEACETVIVPALGLMKRDHMRGLIEPEQEAFILESVAEHLEDTTSPPALAGADESQLAVADDRLVVFGYGVRDAADRGALAVMVRLLAGTGCRFEILSGRMLVSEVLTEVRERRPAGLVLLGLPPGGLVHTRTLCKRLRLASPDLKIAVGRWGPPLPEKQRAGLRENGATYVGHTPAETREHAVSMARLRPAAQLSQPVELQYQEP